MHGYRKRKFFATLGGQCFQRTQIAIPFRSHSWCKLNNADITFRLRQEDRRRDKLRREQRRAARGDSVASTGGTLLDSLAYTQSSDESCSSTHEGVGGGSASCQTSTAGEVSNLALHSELDLGQLAVSPLRCCCYRRGEGNGTVLEARPPAGASEFAFGWNSPLSLE